MPTFRYRALTQTGEIVRGSLTAPTLAEVERRIAYLQLLPIETVEESGNFIRKAAPASGRARATGS